MMKTMFNTHKVIINNNHLVYFHEKNTNKNMVLLSFNIKANVSIANK
jgi:hypothetical protein